VPVGGSAVHVRGGFVLAGAVAAFVEPALRGVDEGRGVGLLVEGLREVELGEGVGEGWDVEAGVVVGVDAAPGVEVVADEFGGGE